MRTLPFGLWRYAVLGLIIAFAGPPIYIHVTKVYGEIQGLDAGIMALILIALRLFDVVQDPFLGWVISKYQHSIRQLVYLFSGIFALGMFAFFTPDPFFDVRLWFIMSLALVYTGFSGLQIIFYSTGLELADGSGTSHAKVAAWREGAILVGISAACVAPVWLAQSFDDKTAYWIFAWIFVIGLIAALFIAGPVWGYASDRLTQSTQFWHLLKNKNIRWLMIIGLVNSIPTGITSTLFLFYAEDRLGTELHAGFMLLVFFLSAAAVAPLWGALAARYSAKTMLMLGMALVVPAFITAAFLGTGDILPFYIICILSGFAMGADMTLLPALVSDELARSGQGGSYTFGIWGFITKMSFAIGAGIALVSIAYGGYEVGAETHSEAALRSLAFSYALVPCVMKIVALMIVWRAPLNRAAI